MDFTYDLTTNEILDMLNTQQIVIITLTEYKNIIREQRMRDPTTDELSYITLHYIREDGTHGYLQVDRSLKRQRPLHHFYEVVI